jgi:hypothetical protein
MSCLPVPLIEWSCCTQRDGWSADAFHERVDGAGAALVVALTGASTQLPLQAKVSQRRQRAAALITKAAEHLPKSRHFEAIGNAANVAPEIVLLHLACAVGGAVVGGYNPAGWTGQGEDKDLISAFLFVWPEGDLSQRPIKIPKASSLKMLVHLQLSLNDVGSLLLRLRPQPAAAQSACQQGLQSLTQGDGSRYWRLPSHPQKPASWLLQVGGPGEAVIRDAPGQGVYFGRDSLIIPLTPGNERFMKSKLGAYYSRRPDGGRHLMSEGSPVKGGSRGTELVSLRVYVGSGTVRGSCLLRGCVLALRPAPQPACEPCLHAWSLWFAPVQSMRARLYALASRGP